MHCKLKMLLALPLAFSPIGQSLASQYQLLIDDDTPTSGTVRLILDNALESDSHFVARHLGESNIKDPVCVTSGMKLPRQESGWLAPASCSEISWKTDFNEALQPEHDVSAQTNLYYPGKWWLFSEWGTAT